MEQGVLVLLARYVNDGPVGSRQVLLGPPHRNEIAPFRALRGTHGMGRLRITGLLQRSQER